MNGQCAAREDAAPYAPAIAIGGGVVEDMVAFIRPIREKVEAILDNPTYLKEVMKMGEEKARKSSKETMDLVRQAIGLKYY